MAEKKKTVIFPQTDLSLAAQSKVRVLSASAGNGRTSNRYYIYLHFVQLYRYIISNA